MNIMLVADCPVIRDEVFHTLGTRPDLHIVATASSAGDAITLLRAAEPQLNVLILDLLLPDRSGFQVIQDTRQFRGALPILVFSSQPEEHIALRALRAGANGFLGMEKDADELTRATFAVAHGGKYVSPRLADWLALNLSGERCAPCHERLTDREFDVMYLLAKGKSVAEAAAMLSRSANTISTCRARMLEKLKIGSINELTQYAISHKLIKRP